MESALLAIYLVRTTKQSVIFVSGKADIFSSLDLRSQVVSFFSDLG